MTIIAWNLNNNQRENWYAGLADRLEDGDLERLRLCPVCHKYFAARDERERFYPKSCKIKYDNKDARFRVKRWRAKQKTEEVDKKQESRNRECEQKVRRFSEFVPFAISNSQDVKNVGRIVIRLGEGDPKEGWRRVERYYNDLKNSISPEQIFKGLPQAVKDYFDN
jgi:hypothetical protein